LTPPLFSLGVALLSYSRYNVKDKPEEVVLDRRSYAESIIESGHYNPFRIQGERRRLYQTGADYEKAAGNNNARQKLSRADECG
jgi:hypothetical protein